MGYTYSISKIKEICTHFFPEFELGEVHPIDTGHINQTFRVSLNENASIHNYLLQKLNTNVFKKPDAVMHNIVQCATFLQEKCPEYPYEILTPVKSPASDQYLLFEDENAWRLFLFIDDAYSLDQVSTAYEARMIGEAFGVFLANINRDSPENYEITIPDFHDFTKRFNSFKQVLADQPDIENEKEKYLIKKIDQYANQYIDLEKMEFPVRIIHHDTKANNVLLETKTGKPRCIIDLDTLMPGDIFSDFGDLMRTVFNPYEEDQFPENGKLVDESVIKSLISGFLMPLNDVLTNNEKEYLIIGGKKITLLQVLRFLEDHLKGDQYYQVRYKGHNLDRALSQVFLFECMENINVSLP